MIIIKDLCVSYDSQQIVFDSLNLSLELNAIHGIVGLNGTGKTTLFNAMYGFVTYERGTLELNGKPLTRDSISMLPTNNYFYSNITGREYLDVFPNRNPTFKLHIWEKLFNLPLDKIIDTYSTGMKKKLALLGVLKLDKPILLLDEPFSGVDIETIETIKILLQKLSEKNKTIIISSHLIDVIANFCDYIHHVKDKKIKESYFVKNGADVYTDVLGSIKKEISASIEKAI